MVLVKTKNQMFITKTVKGSGMRKAFMSRASGLRGLITQPVGFSGRGIKKSFKSGFRKFGKILKALGPVITPSIEKLIDFVLKTGAEQLIGPGASDLLKGGVRGTSKVLGELLKAGIKKKLNAPKNGKLSKTDLTTQVLKEQLLGIKPGRKKVIKTNGSRKKLTVRERRLARREGGRGKLNKKSQDILRNILRGRQRIGTGLVQI